MRPVGKEREELLKRVRELTWVHVIDLGDGEKTPGEWGGHNPYLFEALDAIDFRGKKVLDTGCWDGLFSFEAEKRGASEVYATDLVDQRDHVESPTFLTAKAILGSQAKYYPDVSVYDVEKLGIRDFDVVFFTGVYYHLRDPLRAFSALRRVMKEGAIMLVEGVVLEEEGCHAKYFYKRPWNNDYSNWWVPTRECLRQWVQGTFLDIDREFGEWGGEWNNTRMTMLARAVRRADPYYFRPEADLIEYDLNTYPRKHAEMPQEPVVFRTAPAPVVPEAPMILHAPEEAIPAPVRGRLRRLVGRLTQPGA